MNKMSRKLLMDYEPICLKTEQIIMLNESSNNLLPLFFFIMAILVLMIVVIKREIDYERFYYNRDNHNTKVTVHSMV